jgi:predicted transcriptional regulator
MEQLNKVLEKHTIVIEDPLLRKGFTIVPNLLFVFRGLSHGARLTYVLLLRYAWQEGSCFPGIDRLAEELEVERKSVMRYTKELQDKELITIKRRGMGKTNLYYINRLKKEDISKLKSHV